MPHPNILIPSGAQPDHEDEIPDNDRRGQEASFFDPLRYKLPPLETVRPFFEDRILVRRIEKPELQELLTEEQRISLAKSLGWTGIVYFGGHHPFSIGARSVDTGPCEPDERLVGSPPGKDQMLVELPKHAALLAAPEKAEREKRGPQLGIVIALGPGATGRGILPGDDPKSIPKSERWRRFRWTYYEVVDKQAGGAVISYRERIRNAKFEVKPGDTIWYERMPDQEFVRDGELYTFLYEEQHVIGVVE